MKARFVEVRREPGGGGGLEGRHVLIGLVAFFGVIFAVNGYFLYAALATHTGVVAQEPYRKGLAYNSRIAAEERQSALGWSEELVVERSGRIAISLTGSFGEAVRGLVVQGTIGRPSTARQDRPLRFEASEGRYVADAGQLDEGGWIVEVAARHTDSSEPVYRARRRIWLKP